MKKIYCLKSTYSGCFLLFSLTPRRYSSPRASNCDQVLLNVIFVKQSSSTSTFCCCLLCCREPVLRRQHLTPVSAPWWAAEFSTEERPKPDSDGMTVTLFVFRDLCCVVLCNSEPEPQPAHLHITAEQQGNYSLSSTWNWSSQRCYF